MRKLSDVMMMSSISQVFLNFTVTVMWRSVSGVSASTCATFEFPVLETMRQVHAIFVYTLRGGGGDFGDCILVVSPVWSVTVHVVCGGGGGGYLGLLIVLHCPGRLCDDSTCGGRLKDTIINFGENLPTGQLSYNKDTSIVHLQF